MRTHGDAAPLASFNQLASFREKTVLAQATYGNAELEPKRLNAVWVEPEFLKLRRRKSSSTAKVKR
jgi:hypothetical protein